MTGIHFRAKMRASKQKDSDQKWPYYFIFNRLHRSDPKLGKWGRFWACGLAVILLNGAGRAEIRVLALAAKNYGLNYFLMRDAFDRFGWSVTQTGVSEKIPACPSAGRNGIPPIFTDLPVARISNIDRYAAVVIPPGAGNFTPVPEPFQDLISSPEALNLIRKAVAGGRPVFATCSGSLVLAAAGVLRERRVVGALKFRERIEEAGAVFLGQDHPPVMDRGIVTSARGRYYNVPIAMAVATSIENAWKKRGEKTHGATPGLTPGDPNMGGEDLRWARTLGGARAEGGRALCRVSDGYFLTGYTFARGTGDSDILVVKTDRLGKPVWSRTYGGAGFEYGNACIAAPPGCLIVGYTTSRGAGSKDLYALRIDEDGKEIWSHSYGGESWDVGTAACAAENGGFYLCGFTHSFGEGEEDIYLIRIDDRGRRLWAKTYGGDRFEMANSIHRTRDGFLLIGASTGTFGRGNSDFYVVKSDLNGERLWAKSYGTRGPDGGFAYDWCSALHPTRDGGAILIGCSGADSLQDGALFRIDARGGEVWSRTFGRSAFYDYGIDAAVTEDGGVLAAGIAKQTIEGPALYENRIFLDKFDAGGKAVWKKTLGPAGRSRIEALVIDSDGAPLALGQTDAGGNGAFDVLLLKFR